MCRTPLSNDAPSWKRRFVTRRTTTTWMRTASFRMNWRRATTTPKRMSSGCRRWRGAVAMAEGKKGGQYCTPKRIGTVTVEMLQPFQGRVYDPCCGSGGCFVQSEKFVEEHHGRIGQISVYGQESNPAPWRLASM